MQQKLKLIILADVKEYLPQLDREEISVSRFAEILNNKANESLNVINANKPIIGNKHKKANFLSFYAKNKRIINISAYAESIGVDRRTIYNWINGYYKK